MLDSDEKSADNLRRKEEKLLGDRAKVKPRKKEITSECQKLDEAASLVDSALTLITVGKIEIGWEVCRPRK